MSRTRLARVAAVTTVTTAALTMSGVAAGAAYADRPWTVSCVGDTLSGTLTVPGSAVVRLLAGHDAAHLRDTGLHHSTSGGTVSFSFDISGRAEKLYRVDAVDATGREVARTRPVNEQSCAPGTELPEAPAAILVPLSLLGTAGGAAFASRRFRPTSRLAVGS